MMEPKQSYARRPHRESGHVKDPELHDRLMINIDHLTHNLASVLEIASYIRVTNDAWCSAETGGNTLAASVLAQRLGPLIGAQDELSQTLAAMLFEYPHERLRDVEGSLGIVANEQGVAAAQAILRGRGFDTAADVANAPHMFHLICQDCDRALGIEAEQATDGSGWDGDTAASEVASAFAKTDMDPKKDRPSPAGLSKSQLTRARERCIAALQNLRIKRGQWGTAMVAAMIGIPQEHNAVLRTGTFFNQPKPKFWEMIELDANAMANRVEQDEDLL